MAHDVRPPLPGGFSLWLEPNEREGEKCSTWIALLARRFHGADWQKHVFDPHITLLTLSPKWKRGMETVQSIVDQLGAHEKKFEIEFTGTGQRQVYFQRLFRQAVPNTQLLDLRRRAGQFFRETPDEVYMPHASLLYADPDQELGSVDPNGFEDKMWHIERISLVWAEGYPGDWQTIAHCPLH